MKLEVTADTMLRCMVVRMTANGRAESLRRMFMGFYGPSGMDLTILSSSR